jgi:hypothetical protein
MLKSKTANDSDDRWPFENLNVLLRLHSIPMPTMIATRAPTTSAATGGGDGLTG